MAPCPWGRTVYLGPSLGSDPSFVTCNPGWCFCHSPCDTHESPQDCMARKEMA